MECSKGVVLSLTILSVASGASYLDAFRTSANCCWESLTKEKSLCQDYGVVLFYRQGDLDSTRAFLFGLQIAGLIFNPHFGSCTQLVELKLMLTSEGSLLQPFCREEIRRIFDRALTDCSTATRRMIFQE